MIVDQNVVTYVTRDNRYLVVVYTVLYNNGTEKSFRGRLPLEAGKDANELIAIDKGKILRKVMDKALNDSLKHMHDTVHQGFAVQR